MAEELLVAHLGVVWFFLFGREYNNNHQHHQQQQSTSTINNNNNQHHQHQHQHQHCCPLDSGFFGFFCSGRDIRLECNEIPPLSIAGSLTMLMCSRYCIYRNKAMKHMLNQMPFFSVRFNNDFFKKNGANVGSVYI